ncbi:hypothetical protein [Flavobacterium sp.]|uniref:hypothetical protein n=1 Tax=Flavobacterium sp. TaxID=239 RepID=UPI0026142D98|nr:hypothetical protein [Flavobacterium sp.]
MEIKFQTKKESTKQQHDDFLKLSKAERIYAFFRLMERMSQFPIKNKIDRTKDNFIIELKAKLDNETLGKEY